MRRKDFRTRTVAMFFEEQIRDALRQVDTYGRWLCVICFPVLALLCVVVVARDWIDLIVASQSQIKVSDIIVGVLMTGLLLAIVGLMVCLDYQQRKNPLRCPGCDKNLRPGLQTILLTRSCVACHKQIIQGGKVRSLEFARRYHRRKSYRTSLFLSSGASLLLTTLGSAVIVWEWPTWSEQGRPLILAPVACIVAFTFAFFGYCNWRRWWFVLEMFFAVAIGVLGGWLYWCF